MAFENVHTVTKLIKKGLLETYIGRLQVALECNKFDSQLILKLDS